MPVSNYSSLPPSARSVLCLFFANPSLHISQLFSLPYSRRAIYSSLSRLISSGWLERSSSGYYVLIKKLPAVR
jgi:hypothetical protein